MPLQRCTENGEGGWRYGQTGKCYVGRDAKKKALRQGYVMSPEKFKEEMAHSTEATAQEVDEAIREERSLGNKYLDAVRDHLEAKE